LRRGHANLLCVVPILTDDPRKESEHVLANKRGANSITILRAQLISSVLVSTDHTFRAIENEWLNLKKKNASTGEVKLSVSLKGVKLLECGGPLYVLYAMWMGCPYQMGSLQGQPRVSEGPWQVMIRASAQAGNRTSKTEHYPQWWENSPEWSAATSAAEKRHNSSFRMCRVDKFAKSAFSAAANSCVVVWCDCLL